MSVNSTVIADFSSLTQEELLEEYDKLAHSYEKLKKLYETSMQQIYELKRSLQTSSNAEQYLTTELEQINSIQSAQVEKINQKHSQEIDDLKEKLEEMKEICAGHESIEHVLKTEMKSLKEDMENLAYSQQQNRSIKASEQLLLVSEREIHLDKQVEELVVIIDGLKEKLEASEIQSKEFQVTINELKENIECMKDNLESKRQELEEMQLALDTAHETNIDLNSQLNSYKTNPGDANKKGNSLFAEVHDQRQQVTEVLKEQNTRYQQMKKLLNENEIEMRRLKRANAGICDELRNCSRHIVQADEIFKSQLNERIAFLMAENDSLIKKLDWTEKRLVAMASDKSIDWMDSILDMCKNEVKDSKNKLFHLQMQYSESTTKLWNTERELAKWKFESLKSRFILIDRESILEENNIKFKQFDDIKDEIKIDEMIIENAYPHIGFNERVDDKATKLHNRSFSSHLLEESLSEACYKMEQTTIKSVNDEVKLEVPSVVVTSSSPVVKCSENKENELSKSSLRYRDIVLTPRPLFSATIDPNVRRKNLFPDIDVKEQTVEAKPARSKAVIKVKRIVIPSRKPIKKDEK